MYLIGFLQTEYGQNGTFLVLTIKNFSFCFICLDTGTFVNKIITNLLHESGWEISFLCTKISANQLVF